MKSNGIMKSLQGILDLDSKKRKKKDAINTVLKKLRKKKNKLKKKLESASGKREKSTIAAKLKVNRAQRKKGVQALRALDGKA